MDVSSSLLTPGDCEGLLVDFQAGLAFGVESEARQTVLSNAVAFARTTQAFEVPVIVSTSASRVYSGPLLGPLQAALPGVQSIERRNMNVWEDEKARGAVLATGRKRLLIAGLLTEACVSFPGLSALRDGFEVFIVADACGGLTHAGIVHDPARCTRLAQRSACTMLFR